MTVIFLIVSIILFLTIDWIYRHTGERKSMPSALPISMNGSRRSFSIRIPEGVFFTKSHTWLNLFPSGKVQFGIDDFIGMLMKQPQISLLKNIGDKVKKGEPILEINNGNNRLSIQSPIEGDILAVNEKLKHDPKLPKDSPFHDGWTYTIEPHRITDLKHHMLGSEIKQWMNNEIGRFRDFLAGLQKRAGITTITLQDGGFPNPDVLDSMSQLAWQQFEQEFLQVKSYERDIDLL